MTDPSQPIKSRRRRRLHVVGLLLLLVVALGVGAALLRSANPGAAGQSPSFFVARRGDITISVTENGQVEARHVAVIKSQVEGQATIIDLVSEGAVITPEDVADGFILVELDSSNLRERLVQQEITVASARASYTEAAEAYDIQVAQNESDIHAGQLKVRFAQMDFQKYLGEDIADEIMASLDLDTGQPLDPATGAAMDLGALITDERLGGDALQQRRRLEADILLAGERLQRARDKLAWTQRLFEREYASQSELEADQFEVQSLGIEINRAELARHLFIRYEFPKQIQQLLSDYVEATRQLARTEARARSQLAQAEARLRSNEATRNLQESRLQSYQRQLEACTIRATAPGMVVYARPSRPGSGPNIEIGATVHERQDILSLTDTEEMSVDTKIHEIVIHRIRPGLQAHITIEALPDNAFHGTVRDVAPMPDAQMRWLNPDIRLYSSNVSLRGDISRLRPGISARVEIVIDELDDVVYVPVQAVVNRQGRRVVFVQTPTGGMEERPVETGQFNENFIHIVSGLSEGEHVSLTPPRLIEAEVRRRRPQNDGEQAPETAPGPRRQPIG